MPVYECPAAVASCGKLVQFIGQILPPLSKWDEVKLSVAFPLIAAVLRAPNERGRLFESATLETMRSLVPYLAEFSMCSNHDASSRRAASSCLFCILMFSEDTKCDVGVIKNLMHEVVCPVACDAASSLEEMKDHMKFQQADFSRLGDALSFISLLVSNELPPQSIFSEDVIHLSAIIL